MLAGKKALVTGASRGIGAAIARRLAAEGADVIVNYAKNGDAAATLVARIVADGGSARAVQADIAAPEDVARLFEMVTAQFGRLDILVNNAGRAHPATLEQITPESIDEHFALNVKGLLLSTQAAARLMSEGGVVANISSGGARSPIPYMPVYSATKGAVDVLTRALAVELGPRNIRVVGIAPGLTVTDGTAEVTSNEAMQEFYLSRSPLGRLGQPEDIADVVAFIVSGHGRWITGETIHVSGGLIG